MGSPPLFPFFFLYVIWAKGDRSDPDPRGASRAASRNGMMMIMMMMLIFPWPLVCVLKSLTLNPRFHRLSFEEI